jgi:Tol biopolymer transport system component
MTQNFFTISALLLVCSVAAAAQQANKETPEGGANLQVQVLDSLTGYSIPHSTIKWGIVRSGLPITLDQTTAATELGRLSRNLPEGEYAIEVSAQGYSPLRTHLQISGTGLVKSNINLDPLTPPGQISEQSLRSQLQTGLELVQGYVTSASTHEPIGNAKISFRSSQKGAYTDSQGFFQLYVDAPPSDANGPEDFPALDDLTVTAKGYENHHLTGILHAPGSSLLIRILLTPGTGDTNEHIAHRPLIPPHLIPEVTPPLKNHGVTSPLLEWLSYKGSSAVGATSLPTSSQSSAVVATANVSVPSSIRVGTNCPNQNSKYGCTTMNTYSLETYVQDGLDDEWISTWDPNSLEAGAVAYRSYGATYVNNPVCPSVGSSCPVIYDICADIACQAFTAKSAKPTSDAAKATSGVVLSSDGSTIFFAEYAANTNALYCQDGQAGQPAQSWPCMLDPVAAGSTGSGHGRGLSQWGSQYWARGKSYQGTLTAPRDWRCILDHYYNASSNSITVDPSGTGSPGVGTGHRTAFMVGQPTYGMVAYDAYDTRAGQLSGIRVANAADGSGDKQLVAANSYDPSWEPGGARLAYSNGQGIAIINADGTGNVQLTSNGCPNYPNQSCDFAPSWSPFSGRIAFCSYRSGSTQIWVMNSDGSNLRQLTTALSMQDTGLESVGNSGNEETDCNLSWKPDETAIAYTGLTANVTGDYAVNVYYYTISNGSSIQLTSTNHYSYPSSICHTPTWSPDGTTITFSDDNTLTGDNYGGSGIYSFAVNGPANTPVYQNLNAHEWFPRYSTDGKKILFSSNVASGYWGVYSINPDGTGMTEIIGTGSSPTYQTPMSFRVSACKDFGHL